MAKKEEEVLFGSNTAEGDLDLGSFDSDDFLKSLVKEDEPEKQAPTTPAAPSAPSENSTDKFASVEQPEEQKPISAGDVYGVGLYSGSYKFFTSLLMILLAGLAGGIVYGVGWLLHWYYMDIIIYLPAVNAVVMLLYFVCFAKRGYNYKKHGATGYTSEQSKTYRKQHHMYYNLRMALVLVLLLLLADAVLALSANYLYEVIA